jgi:hypothetical protein
LNSTALDGSVDLSIISLLSCSITCAQVHGQTATVFWLDHQTCQLEPRLSLTDCVSSTVEGLPAVPSIGSRSQSHQKSFNSDDVQSTLATTPGASRSCKLLTTPSLSKILQHAKRKAQTKWSLPRVAFSSIPGMLHGTSLVQNILLHYAPNLGFLLFPHLEVLAKLACQWMLSY